MTNLRNIFDALGDGLFVADADGYYTEANPAACRMMGYAHQDLIGLHLTDILDERELPRLLPFIEDLDDGEIQRSEWLFRRADGSTFTGELVGGKLPDGSYQSAVRDISERVARERQLGVLAHEATHRTKNVLAVVQAIARQTAASSASDFLPTFEDRMRALAASHDLFVRGQWVEVSLRELVEAQLGLFDVRSGDRLECMGPELRITPTAAQVIGMALHELATNAAKYGALSNAEGKVKISWSLGDGDAPIFRMDWQESGGPPASSPGRLGFGTKLIARMTERSLKGSAELSYLPGGLQWHLECPLSALTDV